MISKIELKNFRIFDSLKLDVLNSLVIFSGKNATGKTSILEAIYLCSTTKSHRTTDLNNLIKKDKEFGYCEITENKRYKYVISKTGKKVFINKSEVQKMSEFIGNLPVVLYSPDDISLVKGSKMDKRKFLDMELSMIDKKYLTDLSEYKRILSERNEVLKQIKPDMILLNILTEKLAEYTQNIYKKRISFLNRMNEILNDITKDLKTEKIRLIYNSTYHPENIYGSFKQKEKNDLNLKNTGIGIHRDDFTIEINGMNATEFASEGQSRLICIAIRLSLKQYINEVIHKDPILLLDDVFAALDPTRITNLVKYVKKSTQTFITATSILEIPDELLKDSMVIRL